MNKKKMKKTVATILACAVTCSVLPASESFAARNHGKNTSCATTGEAVSAHSTVVTKGAIDGKTTENTNKHQKPVTSGSAIDVERPNRGDGENKKASEKQKPATVTDGAVKASPKKKAKGKVPAAGKKVKNGKKNKSSNKKVAKEKATGVETTKKKGN